MKNKKTIIIGIILLITILLSTTVTASTWVPGGYIDTDADTVTIQTIQDWYNTELNQYVNIYNVTGINQYIAFTLTPHTEVSQTFNIRPGTGNLSANYGTDQLNLIQGLLWYKLPVAENAHDLMNIQSIIWYITSNNTLSLSEEQQIIYNTLTPKTLQTFSQQYYEIPVIPSYALNITSIITEVEKPKNGTTTEGTPSLQSSIKTLLSSNIIFENGTYFNQSIYQTENTWITQIISSGTKYYKNITEFTINNENKNVRHAIKLDMDLFQSTDNGTILARLFNYNIPSPEYVDGTWVGWNQYETFNLTSYFTTGDTSTTNKTHKTYSNETINTELNNIATTTEIINIDTTTGSVTVKLTDNIQGNPVKGQTITLSADVSSTATTNNEGIATFNLGKMNRGSYDITATFTGTSSYTGSTDSQNQIHPGENSTISGINTAELNSGLTNILGRLTDMYNNPLAGENITATLNGNTYNATTTNNGSLSFDFNVNGLSAGIYTFVVELLDTTLYSNPVGNITLEILEPIIGPSTPTEPSTPVSTPETPNEPIINTSTDNEPVIENITSPETPETPNELINVEEPSTPSTTENDISTSNGSEELSVTEEPSTPGSVEDPDSENETEYDETTEIDTDSVIPMQNTAVPIILLIIGVFSLIAGSTVRKIKRQKR